MREAGKLPTAGVDSAVTAALGADPSRPLLLFVACDGALLDSRATQARPPPLPLPMPAAERDVQRAQPSDDAALRALLAQLAARRRTAVHVVADRARMSLLVLLGDVAGVACVARRRGGRRCQRARLLGGFVGASRLRWLVPRRQSARRARRVVARRRIVSDAAGKCAVAVGGCGERHALQRNLAHARQADAAAVEKRSERQVGLWVCSAVR